MSGELQGNALVTGGSRGIGRSCALAAARRGADVAITYVANKDAAESTAEEIRALGRRVAVIQGDVGDPEDNVRAVEEAIAALGPLRYLVANAANGTFGMTNELTVEQWDYTMAAHVRALLTLAQARDPRWRPAAAPSSPSPASAPTASTTPTPPSAPPRRRSSSWSATSRSSAARTGSATNCISGGVVLTDLFKEIPEWETIAAAAAERSPLGPRSTRTRSASRSASSSPTKRAWSPARP